MHDVHLKTNQNDTTHCLKERVKTAQTPAKSERKKPLAGKTVGGCQMLQEGPVRKNTNSGKMEWVEWAGTVNFRDSP